MCHLCKDTFSRSDILKRHFQKCSIRRGNPTGANHLAHQRRNTGGGGRLSISQQDGPIGLAGLSDIASTPTFNSSLVGTSPTVAGEMSARSSRANSLISPSTMSHRNSLAGLGIVSASGVGNGDPLSTSAGYQPPINAYALQNSTNGAQLPSAFPFSQSQLNGTMFNNHNPQQQQQSPMSFLGQPSSRFDNSQNNNPHNPAEASSNVPEADWSGMFTQGGRAGFMESQPANASSQVGTQLGRELDVKSSYPSQLGGDAFLGSVSSHANAAQVEGRNGESENMQLSAHDSLYAKVDDLKSHCFPSGPEAIRGDVSAELMWDCLEPETIRHLHEQSYSYQAHWPILHVPTFDVAQANNNLIMVLLCLGAIYSPDPKYHVQTVRHMMEFTKTTVYRTASVLSRAATGSAQGLTASQSDVEEIQALSMLQTIFTWHGNPAQRQAARADFVMLTRTIKVFDLQQTAPDGHYAHSTLHSIKTLSANQLESFKWDWHVWLEQEKRNRLMYQVWLMDTAMVLFFNTSPQFDSANLKLMMPSDDAVWEATTSESCADALGLNGPAAQTQNLNGTRQPIQPTLHDALRALFESSAPLQTGATNIFAKFLLIHALIVRVISCQMALLRSEGHVQGYSIGLNGSTPATPLSQNDWLEQNTGRTDSLSANNSGNVTPTEPPTTSRAPSVNMIQHEKARLEQALNKWKASWDLDMQIQFPRSEFQPKRFGFSRDSVHFYYIARSFLQSSNLSEFAMPADMRFRRVMGLLKRVKTMIADDHGNQGPRDVIGSVGDIDDHYGLDNLTLDMTLLFARDERMPESPLTISTISGPHGT
jgi:hypothetical protein